jgi:hypothetical protein
MSNASKMNISTVYEIFEEINKKLNKQADSTVEPVQVNMTAIDAVTERLENVIEEVRNPIKVEYQHRHTIDIRSNWFFFSWVALVIIIFGLFWILANQWQTISQYKDNDLKYRYIRMHGQTNEEDLYRLERQFQYSDSIKIIRKQVGKYEELVREQAERVMRAKRATIEAEALQKRAETVKMKDK